MDNKQYNDDFFINLTMEYDKRIDDIYCAWAVWCAKSDDRYFIDGKDGYFYTHVRTDEEIAIERKKRVNMEFVMKERDDNQPLEPDTDKYNKFLEYEEYVRSLEMDEDFLEKTPKTFKEWCN